MNQQLTREEAAYVLPVIREHVEFYRALAANDKCSDKSRARYELVRGLVAKLEQWQAS